MSTQPMVSFCFTTYKRGEYLKSTLNSILQQTFSDYEVVVSDNDPEQSGRKVVEGMEDPRFKYFPNETNLGMKKSFNQSLKRSTGQYIVMIADDDPVYPDMLETLMKIKEQVPGYGLYLGACNWYCEDPEIARLYKLKVGMNTFLARGQQEGKVMTYSASNFLKDFFDFKIFDTYLWSNAIVRKDILVEMGGVPDYGTPFLGDYAYLSIMGSHSGCVVINKALGHQTIHRQNFGRNQNHEISIVVTNFIEYVSSKINKVKDWPEIEKKMHYFIAIWAISHLGFLYHYNRIFSKDNPVDLRPYEKELFAIPLMKKYHLKYWLKTRMPAIHDLIVTVKKKIIQK